MERILVSWSFVASRKCGHIKHNLTQDGRRIEDVETAQDEQESMMEYHELEGCLGIKSEVPDIKKEEDECDSVVPSEDNEFYNPETNYVFIKSDPDQNASELEMESPKDHKLIEDVTETRYYCKLCPYVARRKGDLSKHVPIHKRSLETKTYDCSFCSYKTNRRNTLTRHMLIHQDASEVTTFDCSFCSYKTKRKGYLTTHMLIHKDASDITTHQCTLCPYQAKQKSTLKRHMLIHKDASEVTTYDCFLCSYKTKRKADLKSHTLIHKDASEIMTYDCDFCSYKGKLKRDLNRHMLIHKDASEITTHQCALCPYKAKLKSNLRKHMLTHKDASEVTTYDCSFCSYKAKHEGDLRSHTLIHKEVSEDVETAQNQQESMMESRELEGCLGIKLEEPDIKKEVDECDSVMPSEDTKIISFGDKSDNPETNNMSIKSEPNQNTEIEMESPKGHKLIDDAAERRYYCQFCPYVAKQKEDLSKHVPIHQKSLKQEFMTAAKHKGNFNKHMLIHKDASEITTYDCCFCSYKAKQKKVV
ncbi:hypothetical protein NQ318_021760 [Aromia moschata]|uniref:C2H2-type domain-containing protein n=1 Tax=Aromia moschata TaxID=1265417 RepID=A0AAV8XHD9_9CUCU|nr:hypothetical protein NQ318_021760 [Aromia moschata]